MNDVRMSRDFVHLCLLRHQENERVVSSSEPVWSRELINIAYAQTCHTPSVSNELSADLTIQFMSKMYFLIKCSFLMRCGTPYPPKTNQIST